jgi:type IV pilus assembly protein PilV
MKRNIPVSLRARSRGFNLIEVLVAVVVISVGLLGIAKMQALAIASTGTARMRSLASLEAASLASALRADRAYWSAIAAGTAVTVTFTNGAIATSSDTALSAATANCTSAGVCTTAAQVTAYDLRDWAARLSEQMQSYYATLTCATPAVQPAPNTCVIQINWVENRVGVNSQNAATALSTSFKLYVEP